MLGLMKQLGHDERGATALEYAMVAFFISIAAFAVLTTVGTSVTQLFQRIANGFLGHG